MTSLRDFIAARLDEDQQVALAATAGPWAVLDAPEGIGEVHKPDAARKVEYPHLFDGRTLTSMEYQYVTLDHEGIEPSVSPEDATHIARHDPARVLREVTAKRRIMERHSRYDGSKHLDYCAGCPSGDDSGYPDVALEDCPELQDMAFIWNENEDWSIAWCPHVEGRYATPVLELPPARGCYTNACNRCGQGDGWHYRNRKDRAA